MLAIKTGLGPICHIWWWSLGSNKLRKGIRLESPECWWFALIKLHPLYPLLALITLNCFAVMYHIWVRETEKDFLCACIYTSNIFQMGQENMLHCLPSPSAPSLLVELILIFLWKACVRCHFTWVEWNKRSFVAGSGFGLEGVCVYILEVWWCIPCGQTTNCCAEQYMAYRRGVSEARGSCQRCLSVTVLLRQGMLLKSMQPEILFGRGSE